MTMMRRSMVILDSLRLSLLVTQGIQLGADNLNYLPRTEALPIRPRLGVVVGHPSIKATKDVTSQVARVASNLHTLRPNAHPSQNHSHRITDRNRPRSSHSLKGHIHKLASGQAHEASSKAPTQTCHFPHQVATHIEGRSLATALGHQYQTHNTVARSDLIVEPQMLLAEDFLLGRAA